MVLGNSYERSFDQPKVLWPTGCEPLLYLGQFVLYYHAQLGQSFLSVTLLLSIDVTYVLKACFLEVGSYYVALANLELGI